MMSSITYMSCTGSVGGICLELHFTCNIYQICTQSCISDDLDVQKLLLRLRTTENCCSTLGVNMKEIKLIIVWFTTWGRLTYIEFWLRQHDWPQIIFQGCLTQWTEKSKACIGSQWVSYTLRRSFVQRQAKWLLLVQGVLCVCYRTWSGVVDVVACWSSDYVTCWI